MDKCQYRRCGTNICHPDNRRHPGDSADAPRETSVGHDAEVVEALQDKQQEETRGYKERYTVNVVFWELQWPHNLRNKLTGLCWGN